MEYVEAYIQVHRAEGAPWAGPRLGQPGWWTCSYLRKMRARVLAGWRVRVHYHLHRGYAAEALVERGFGGGSMRQLILTITSRLVSLPLGRPSWDVSMLLLCHYSPADLESLVRVFNVYQTGREALPGKVEGCEHLGGVTAAATAP